MKAFFRYLRKGKKFCGKLVYAQICIKFQTNKQKKSSLFCWDCSPEVKGNKYLLMARPGARPAKPPCPSRKEVLGALWRSGGLSFSSTPHFLERTTYTEENRGPQITQVLRKHLCVSFTACKEKSDTALFGECCQGSPH